MVIKNWLFNPCRTACYVLTDEPTGECVVIDPCAYSDGERFKLLGYLKSHNLKPQHVLLTHAHFDHLLAVDLFAMEYCLYPELHVLDKPLLPQLSSRIDEVFGRGVFRHRIVYPSRWLNDDDEIRFGDTMLRVVHTPGHTPGSVSYYCETEGVVFTGDTLFCGDVGRTDFPYSSSEDLRRSLSKLFTTLPLETKVFSGHDARPTTIARELHTTGLQL